MFLIEINYKRILIDEILVFKTTSCRQILYHLCNRQQNEQSIPIERKPTQKANDVAGKGMGSKQKVVAAEAQVAAKPKLERMK